MKKHHVHEYASCPDCSNCDRDTLLGKKLHVSENKSFDRIQELGESS